MKGARWADRRLVAIYKVGVGILTLLQGAETRLAVMEGGGQPPHTTLTYRYWRHFLQSPATDSRTHWRPRITPWSTPLYSHRLSKISIKKQSVIYNDDINERKVGRGAVAKSDGSRGEWLTGKNDCIQRYCIIIRSHCTK